MEKVAKEEEIDFILNTGDNYYGPKGDPEFSVTKWNEQFVNVYSKYPHLKPLSWFGVLGNKDYQSKLLHTQFYIKDNGWRLDDFFFSHKMEIDRVEIVFVHIDTNYLAYGRKGEDGNKMMKEYFRKHKMDDEMLVASIEHELEKHKNVAYKVCVGHHPIGHHCGETQRLPLIQPLLKKYGF